MTQAPQKTSALGIVVIGRDEGERLVRCLRSVCESGAPVVYVDSGSSDGSVDLARRAEAEVVELDPEQPFTAARARNAGFAAFELGHPRLDWVQFVDGDCELEADWLEHAAADLAEHDEISVVCGRVRERHPDRSIYNRLCDLDWSPSIGEVEQCGGIFMIRAGVFRELAGFDASIVSGEEPELCLRIRRRGGRIVRRDLPMARHDAGLLHFSQWWARERRNGYGHLDLAQRFALQSNAPFTGWVRSARLWGIAWPLALVAAGLLGAAFWGPTVGLGAGLFVATLWPAQLLRIAVGLRRDRAGLSWSLALAWAFYAMLGKWPQLLGQRHFAQTRSGRPAKQTGATA